MIRIGLEILFALLVAADTWLTYRIIETGKGVEIGIVAKHYIHSLPLTILISIVGWVLIVGMLRLTGFWFFLIPVDLCMARVVYRNMKVLNG